LETIAGLHANLLAGRPGRLANGLGAVILLLLGVTGVVIWWPGVASWRRALTVDLRRSWRRVNWELHGATGVWTLLSLVMWAATGVYLASPSAIRTALNTVLPLTMVAPASNPAGASQHRPTWREMIARAEAHVPDQHVFRVLPPAGHTATFQVMFTRTRNPPRGRERLLRVVHVDQYTGRILKDPLATRTPGDLIIEWIGPLHVGNFGGVGVRIVWSIAGLAPAVLAVTGFIMWWSRVVRPRALRLSARL
jgi:uncharacterized iron-regulated membrane protein